MRNASLGLPSWRVIALAVTFIIAGCAEQSAEEGTSNGQSSSSTFSKSVNSTPVKTVQVEAAAIKPINLVGRVVMPYQTALGFQVEGKIAERLVNPGQTVSKGDVLMALDNEDYSQAVVQASADVRSAQAALSTAQTDWRRAQDLFKDKVIGAQQYDQYKLQLDTATEQLEAAKARLEQVNNAFSYTKLIAPDDGIILSVAGEPGALVDNKFVAAVLAHGDYYDVELSFPEHFYPPKSGEIKWGRSKFPITQRYVSGALDPASFTWSARFKIDTPRHQVRLPLGTLVKASFTPDMAAVSMSVPLAAIDARDDQARIWQVKNGVAAVTPVTVEHVDVAHALISSDTLKIGDPVIAHGINRLTVGDPVRVVTQ